MTSVFWRNFTSVEYDIHSHPHVSYEQLATKLEDRVVKASHIRIAARQHVV